MTGSEAWTLEMEPNSFSGLDWLEELNCAQERRFCWPVFGVARPDKDAQSLKITERLHKEGPPG